MTDCIRVGPDTTRKDLIAQGVTEEGADELMDYQTYLLAKEAGDFDGDYEDWREADAYCPKCVSEKCDVPVSSLGTGNWIYCAEHSADPAPPEQDGEGGREGYEGLCVLVPVDGDDVKYHLEDPGYARKTLCGREATDWSATGELLGSIPRNMHTDATFCRVCLDAARRLRRSEVQGENRVAACDAVGRNRLARAFGVSLEQDVEAVWHHIEARVSELLDATLAPSGEEGEEKWGCPVCEGEFPQERVDRAAASGGVPCPLCKAERDLEGQPQPVCTCHVERGGDERRLLDPDCLEHGWASAPQGSTATPEQGPHEALDAVDRIDREVRGLKGIAHDKIASEDETAAAVILQHTGEIRRQIRRLYETLRTDGPVEEGEDGG